MLVAAVDDLQVTVTAPRPAAPEELAATTGSFAASPADSRRPLLALVFVVAALVSAVCIAAHAMWFDELQAWGIARASHSLTDLAANLRYEGHPPLWYLLLYGITRVTGDPRAMQVLSWLIAVATAWLLVFRSPFPIGMRIGLVAGYFFAFEYTVISRAYGLGVLLLIAALVCIARATPRWGSAAVLLALLAGTSLASAAFVGALALVLAWQWWRARATDRAEPRRLVCAIVGAVAAGVSALMCIPPSDFHSFSVGIPNSSSAYVDPRRIAGALGGTWRGLVPIPVGPGRWNTNVIDQWPGAVWVQAVVSIALVVLVAAVLRRYATAFALWLVGTAVYVAFSLLVVLPDRAHYAGVFFLLFVACAWLAYAAPGGGPAVPREWRRGLPAMLVAVIAAQILTTLLIVPDSTFRPFSPDHQLAEAAERAGIADSLVSGHDFHGVAIAGYLDRPVYSAARGAWISFFPNDEREAIGNDRMTDATIMCAAITLAESRGHATGIVTDRNLSGPGVEVVRSSQGVQLLRVRSGVAASTECPTQQAR